MTPDRLNVWIYKTCPGGTRLQLAHDQSLQSAVIVNSWEKEDVAEARENPPGDSIGDQLLVSAQEYADNLGESCKFTISWMSANGHPIRAMIHRAGPAQPVNEYAANAGNVSGNATQAQLLSHIHQQQKVINGSIGAILTAYERTIAMQAGMINSLAQRIDTAPQPSVEDAEVTRLKIRALEKATELGPDVFRLFLAAASRWMVGGKDIEDDTDAAGDVVEGLNGAARA
jgi:hypothetical protein